MIGISRTGRLLSKFYFFTYCYLAQRKQAEGVLDELFFAIAKASKVVVDSRNSRNISVVQELPGYLMRELCMIAGVCGVSFYSLNYSDDRWDYVIGT
uniref:Uncharacterized protein n=1 Tax=Parascaris univalens TaxID=6257 RepID=A0A915ANU3_PARUN